MNLEYDLINMLLSIKVACKKYQAAIQMLQDMNDRSNTTLAMLGLVKTLLALDTQNQMVSSNTSHNRFFFLLP